MRIIALEEAFSIPELAARYRGVNDLGPIPLSAEFTRHVAERLPDLTELRLAEMDRFGVDVQVLSLTAPGIQADLSAEEAVVAARYANDFLADAISKTPDRFAGLAALPMQDPSAAVTELRRAVTDLGLQGVLINDQTQGLYLDDPVYTPFWATLEDLGVPLYLHPGSPPVDRWKVLDGRPELVGPTWSWGAETGAHALRLIYSGVFDRHPGVRLILGHMGEYLPFMMSRLDSRYATLAPEHPIERKPSQYIGSNVLITVSGVPSPAALAGAVLAVGADAVLFAIDYPYESTESAVDAFLHAPLSDVDRHKIAHGNAERLLNLPT